MKKIVRFIPSIIIIVMILSVIFGFSTQTGTQSSGISRKATVVVQKIITRLNGSPERSDYEVELIVRKFAHFLEYFFYTSSVLMIFRNLVNKFYYVIPLSLVLTLPIAYIDEFIIQVQSPGRTPMLMDVGIDLLGVFIAMSSYILFVISEINIEKSIESTENGV